MRLSSYFVLIGILLHVNAVAQRMAGFITPEARNTITSNQVNDILQDSQGYLWYATGNGLNRYDGYQFQTFYHIPNDSSSLPVNDLNVLAEDEHGYLWIGTNNGGLCRFNPSNHHVTRFNVANYPNLSANNVKALYADQHGSLWIGTFGGGLVHLDLDTFTFSPFRQQTGNPNSLPNNSVFAIQPDHNGSLWIATLGGGLCRFNLENQSFKTFRAQPGVPGQLPSNDIYSLFMDSQHILWIGTFGQGLVSFDPVNEQFVTPNHQPGGKAEYILDIEQDPMGNLWLASQQHGLIRLQNGTLTPLPPDSLKYPGLNNFSINALCMDKGGNLWIGSEKNGIFRLPLNSLAFTNFIGDGKHIENFNAGAVMALIQDRNHHFWVGTFGNGLFQLNPEGKVVNRFSSEIFEDSVINALYQDKQQKLWIGTGSHGIYELANGNFNSVPFYSGNKIVSEIDVESIVKDKQGTLWAGTFQQGLFYYDEEQNKFTNAGLPAPEVPGGWATVNIRLIREAPSGGLWIGSRNNGLFYLSANRSQLSQYLDQSKGLISRKSITGISFSDSLLWVSTLDGGLCLFNPESKRIQPFNELVTRQLNEQSGMVQVSDSILWITTKYGGLLRFNTKRQVFTSYNHSNGLPVKELQTLALGEGANQNLLMGTLQGFISFKPGKLYEHNRVAPLAFTNLRAIGESDSTMSVQNSNSVELPAGDRSFTVSFALLSYSGENNIRYESKLDGLDKRWINLQQNHSATYTNLDPGNYTLFIRGYVINRPADQVVKKLLLYVPPLWYERWWFKVTLILTVALSLLLWIWYKDYVANQRQSELELIVEERTRKLKEHNKLIAEEKTKAEEASRAKETFLSTMSHELRTPMNAVIGTTYLLLQDTPTPSQKENLNILKFSSEHLLQLINDILDYQKIHSGSIKLEQIPFNLYELCRRTKFTFLNSAKQKNVFLKLFIDDSVPEYVVGDAVRINQVLTNLLGNAIKFTSSGYVKLELLLEKYEDGNAHIKFKVEDTGIGIPAEKIDEIFNSFSQADSSINRLYGGTGLGLAITRKIIQMHGSKIGVSSSVNKGSVFSFTLVLPEAQQPVQESDTRKATTNQIKKGLQILLVEDNRMNVMVARKYMEKWGIQVSVAENGLVALDAVAKKHYDLILMDLQMPVMNGYQASSKIRELDGQIARTPILAITASNIAEVREKIYQSGMNDYLVKPFDPVELYDKIVMYTQNPETDISGSKITREL